MLKRPSVHSKEDSAKLSGGRGGGSLQTGVSHKSPMSPKKGSALALPSHSVIGGEQSAGDWASLHCTDGFPKAAARFLSPLGPSCKRLARCHGHHSWVLAAVIFKDL